MERQICEPQLLSIDKSFRICTPYTGQPSLEEKGIGTYPVPKHFRVLIDEIQFLNNKLRHEYNDLRQDIEELKQVIKIKNTEILLLGGNVKDSDKKAQQQVRMSSRNVAFSTQVRAQAQQKSIMPKFKI